MKVKVLVFEDEPQLRSELIRSLEGEGYEVLAFALPSRAMEALEEADEFPKLALLDIKLDNVSSDQLEAERAKGFQPDTAGIELATRILKQKRIPVIFMTGHPDQYKNAMLLQPSAFFVKGNIDYQIEVPRAIHLAIHNFENAAEHQPDFKLIDPGKVCLNISVSGNGDGPRFRRIILEVDDILYFATQGGITHVYVKGQDRPYSLTLPAIDLYRQMEELLQTKNQSNPFRNIYRGCYANVSNVKAYDSECAYFDHSGKVFCYLNPAHYQLLSAYYPPFINKA